MIAVASQPRAVSELDHSLPFEVLAEMEEHVSAKGHDAVTRQKSASTA